MLHQSGEAPAACCRRPAPSPSQSDLGGRRSSRRCARVPLNVARYGPGAA
jgi:hypothetical protein